MHLVLIEFGEKQKLKFKIDPTKKPREIDWFSDEKGKPDLTEARGIYEIDADTLKLSLAGRNSTRKIDPTTGKVIEDKLEPVGKRPKAIGEKDAIQLILKREKK